MAYAKSLPARAVINNRCLSDAKYHLRHAANIAKNAEASYYASSLAASLRYDVLLELAAICAVEWWINLPEVG